MEAISRSCLPEAAARTKRQRKATCCGVLGAASHRTTCSRSSAAKLTSGLILAMRTHISYCGQYDMCVRMARISPLVILAADDLEQIDLWEGTTSNATFMHGRYRFMTAVIRNMDRGQSG